MGRSFLGETTIEVNVRNKEIVYDTCGGYWMKIPDNQGTVVFTIVRKKENLNLFKDTLDRSGKWTSPSYYIDSDNDSIAKLANSITQGITSTLDKAKAIHQFVMQHFNFDPNYRKSFLDKASETLENGYGTCMNFSRIFVALCRAAGLNARTVWGIVYGYNNDNIYDYHHQWAEVQDDEGTWHPLDLDYTTNFDLNDIRYLDLIYAAEENSVIIKRWEYNIAFEHLIYKRNYPVTTDARLGFQLISDDRPDSMSLEFVWELGE